MMEIYRKISEITTEIIYEFLCVQTLNSPVSRLNSE